MRETVAGPRQQRNFDRHAALNHMVVYLTKPDNIILDKKKNLQKPFLGWHEMSRP
jgi:hypothetical protein